MGLEEKGLLNVANSPTLLKLLCGFIQREDFPLVHGLQGWCWIVGRTGHLRQLYLFSNKSLAS
ncbi:hypothetical protein J6590_069072, partial [Homalodisca vitripennis]